VLRAALYGLRQQTCLALIKEREQQLSAQYRFVFRGRPDLWLPCRLPHIATLHTWNSGSRSHPRRLPRTKQWILYFYDHAALMSRAAADVSLDQVPGAAAIETCRSLEERKVEYCNMCLLVRAGSTFMNVTTYYAYFPAPNHFNTFMDVARSCQLMSESRRPCFGAEGPNETAAHFTRLAVNETCPVNLVYAFEAVGWLAQRCKRAYIPTPGDPLLPRWFVDEFVPRTSMRQSHQMP